MGKLVAAALLIGCAGGASAQDGGKVEWRGKGKNDDIQAIMADAKKAGKPMMLFFTSDG